MYSPVLSACNTTLQAANHIPILFTYIIQSGFQTVDSEWGLANTDYTIAFTGLNVSRMLIIDLPIDTFPAK